MLSPYPQHETLQERNQFIIEREAQIGRWRAEIARMELEISGGNLIYQDQLTNLKRKLTKVEEQLENLKEATGQVWEESKPDAEETWEALSTSFEKLKKELERNIS